MTMNFDVLLKVKETHPKRQVNWVKASFLPFPANIT